MSVDCTSVVRILHMADFHFGHSRSDILPEKYNTHLPALLDKLRKDDASRVDRLSNDRLADAFIILHDHLVPSTSRARAVDTREALVSLLRHNSVPKCEALVQSVYTTELQQWLSRSDYSEARNALRTKYAAGLRDLFCEFANHRCPIDIVVVAGDLVHKGYASDKNTYHDNMRRAFDFITKLANNVLRLDRDRFVIVSGNHDRYMTQTNNDKWRPSLHALLRRLNKFYGDSMPEYPVDQRGRAWFRLFRFDNQLLGNLAEPSRLVIVATQAEYLATTYDQPDKVSSKHRQKTDACLTWSQYRRIASHLRSQIPLAHEPDFLIVSCAHREISQTDPTPDPVCCDLGNQPAHRFARLAHDWRIALHLCGHDHESKATREDAARVTLPHQYASVWAPWGFQLFELPNRFPDIPDVRPPSVFLFEEEKDALNRFEGSAAKSRPRVILSPLRVPGLRTYLVKGVDQVASDAGFRVTLGKKNHEAHMSLKSYISLFRDVPEGRLVCPYPDVYTRYFPWIIDTAVEMEDGPSDVMIVVHVGPFTQWLEEPMNSNYYIQQVKAARERRLAVFRIWLIPALDETHARQEYAFTQYANSVAQDSCVVAAVKEAGIWANPYRGTATTYRDAVEALLCPRGDDGKRLENYTSMVLTHSMLAMLAGVAEQTVTTSVESAFGDSELFRSFCAVVRTCQMDSVPCARNLRSLCKETLAFVVDRANRWKLFVGSAVRRGCDGREELLFGYLDDKRREAVAVSGKGRCEGVEHVARVAEFGAALASHNVEPALRGLSCLRVESPAKLRSFVDIPE